jgi:hypothetical protein
LWYAIDQITFAAPTGRPVEKSDHDVAPFVLRKTPFPVATYSVSPVPAMSLIGEEVIPAFIIVHVVPLSVERANVFEVAEP